MIVLHFCTTFILLIPFSHFRAQWPALELSDHAPHPKIRLDFILASEEVLSDSESDSASVGSLLLHAGIEINAITDMLSDHYPVSINLKQ